MLFTAVRHLCVYCPLAHWIFYPGGWLAQYGAVDFAGGLVIHISSGVAALVLAFWLNFISPHKPRPHVPHNVPFVLLGAALLWFGWFGFNAGSALGANYQAGLAFSTTQLGAATGLVTWNVIEVIAGGAKWGEGRPTAVGAASGVVAGLVGVTPSAGFVSPMWGAFIGFFTVLCAYPAPRFVKQHLKIDDCLDAFGIHGVGGMVGAALTGLFADSAISDAKDATGAYVNGGFYRNGALLGKQCAAISATVLYTAVATSVIFLAISAIARAFGDTIDLPAHQRAYPDTSQHGEAAYFTGERAEAEAPKAKPAATPLSAAAAV